MRSIALLLSVCLLCGVIPSASAVEWHKIALHDRDESLIPTPLWQGVEDYDELLSFYEMLPITAKPHTAEGALTDLLLLTSLEMETGRNYENSIFIKRLRYLSYHNRAKEIITLLQQVNLADMGSSTRRVYMDALLRNGMMNQACALADRTKEQGQFYFTLAHILCLSLQDKKDEALSVYERYDESKQSLPCCNISLNTIINRVASREAQQPLAAELTDDLYQLTPVEIMLLNQAEYTFPDEVLKEQHEAIQATLATYRIVSAQPAQLAIAHEAFKKGLLSYDEIKEKYNAWVFDELELKELVHAPLNQEADALFTARYTNLLTYPFEDPKERSEAVLKVLKWYEMHDIWEVFLPVIIEQLKTIKPNPEIEAHKELAPLAIKYFSYTGNETSLLAWLSFVLEYLPDNKDNLRMFPALAITITDPGLKAILLENWLELLEKNNAYTTDPLLKNQLVLMESFGFEIPLNVWRKLALNQPTDTSENPLSTEEIEALTTHAAHGQTGPVIALSLNYLSRIKSDSDLIKIIGDVTTALNAVGLNQCAKMLATQLLLRNYDLA